MKKLIIAIIAAFAVTLGTAQPAVAQRISASQRAEVVDAIKMQLPLEAAKGVVFSDCYMSDNNRVFNMVLDLNETKMGVTLDEVKSKFGEMTAAQFRKEVGSDIIDTLRMLGCKGRVTFRFSDGTSKTFDLDPYSK